MKLNREQKSILEHTNKNSRYCGGSKDMTILCENGLMEYIGRLFFVPDPYYKITKKGKNLIGEKDE